MTAPLYEQSDFASPDETIIERRARLHPLPAKRDIAGFVVMGIGGAVTFLLAVFVAYGLAAMG